MDRWLGGREGERGGGDKGEIEEEEEEEESVGGRV